MTKSALSIGPQTLDSIPNGAGQPVDANFTIEETGGNSIHVSPAASKPAQPEQQQVPQRPADIPEKFWDAEKGTVNTAALLASYAELEKKQSKAAEPKPDVPDPAKPADQKPGDPQSDTSTDDKPKDDAKPATIDFEAYGTELATNGKLSDESYAALEKFGLNREMTDTYIAGIQAIQTLNGQKLHAAAGSAEAYNAMVEWGTKNLSQAEQDAFNKSVEIAIATGDDTSAKLLIEGIKAKMGGGEPNYVQGKNKPGGGVQPFASRSEMAEAMNDPRYSRDAAYVAEVQARLAVSNF